MGGKDWGSVAETGWKAACGEWDACFQANGVHMGIGGKVASNFGNPRSFMPSGGTWRSL